MKVSDSPVPPTEDDVPNWAVRLEAKIDVALANHSNELSNTNRRVSNVEDANDALSTRVTTLENSNFVTTKGLAATILGSITAVGGFIALLDRLMTP